MNEPTKKQNVRSGSQRSPDVCHSRGAAETRIDVNNLRPAFFRFDHPLETDRVILSHIRTHNQNDISVHEIAWRQCGSATAEGGAQTGHRGAVSNTGLVTDADHPQTGCEELLDQIIFFIVESGAPKVSHSGRMHYDLSIALLHERALSRIPDAVGDHVDRLLKI